MEIRRQFASQVGLQARFNFFRVLGHVQQVGELGDSGLVKGTRHRENW